MVPEEMMADEGFGSDVVVGEATTGRAAVFGVLDEVIRRDVLKVVVLLPI